ncbi:MAG TPA: plastocyanin/azurin family copper-binding protein [Candidatus Bathyarchaeia archaeon]|nr:plastocyanin/azurin family copper-binding protein [Candidatus Bathyarchaeia archaeon]
METTPKPPEVLKSKGSPWKLIAIVIVILIVVGVAAYILTLPPSSTTANILIKDDSACGASPPDTACLFSPASYQATVNGPAVVWKNTGGVPHTATSNSTANGSLPSFNSNSIAINGGIFSFTFTKAGNYSYYCNIHLWMKGTIIVK